MSRRIPHPETGPDNGQMTGVQELLTASVERAAHSLRTGGLAALPTETVYGLGALAGDEQAVARIFTVKGRPADHPLIVHLPDITHLDQWSRGYPGWARAVAEEFWPGPLTLIVPRSSRVSDSVTGGQPTVGLRVPAHALTLEVLAAVATGVAAPSANRFGGVSPTTAEHVLSDIGDRLDPERDVILDGGPCVVGVESTIVLAVDDQPRILRPGAVSASDITRVSGMACADNDAPRDIRVSGSLDSHYSPHADVVLCSMDDVEARALAARDSGTVGLIALDAVATPSDVMRLSSPRTEVEYAHDLYAALRRADARGIRTVLAVAPDATDTVALAILDRLTRAAH